MTSFTTFYLSRIIGKKIFNAENKSIGIIKDLLIETNHNETPQPKVIGIKIKQSGNINLFSFDGIRIEKQIRKLTVKCSELTLLSDVNINNSLLLSDIILDKQLVDLNGRKLVRVNDIRLVQLAEATYALAVDVGIEGLLRRIGVAKEMKYIFNFFGKNLPAKFISWEDIEAVDFSNLNIKLSKTQSKLHSLHPSDIADIIEDLGGSTRASIFSQLDEEKAADVLEEMEPAAQISLIESLPIEKAADILEKMPANEAADIIEELEDERAEQLLKEMDAESSEDVRELLEYDNNEVGSVMTTEFLSFPENMPVFEVLTIIRLEKPENDALYNLFVTNEKEQLIATLSLRDIIISEPATLVSKIMKTNPITVKNTDKVYDLAELISKYNLLSIPVIDEDKVLHGMVVIDDIVEDLINKGRTNK
ncbi:MAG: CBS domain-containing protein [Bacteroidota bacterium]